MGIQADEGFVFESTKTYTHAQGLSVAFRQWRAPSHCRLIHGYSIQVKLTFESTTLDERNWVIDFGGLKRVKGWLEDNFDHRLIVAQDDPEKSYLWELHCRSIAHVVVLPHVGMEYFAYHIFKSVSALMIEYYIDYVNRVKLMQVEVREHESNSAIYRRLGAHPHE